MAGSPDDPRPRPGSPAVRVLAPDGVAAALARANRAVVRPHRWGEVAEVMHALSAQRSVVVELDGLDERGRRRALDVMLGVAYGLEARVSDVEATPHVYVCEPRSRLAPSDRGSEQPTRSAPLPAEAESDAHEHASGTRAAGRPEWAVCVLCDLRPAATSFDPPHEMVIRGDGSRIWAPRAHVCDHCRGTIRHWRFAVAWCPECERWGRRGVTSPCGSTYGT